MPNRAYHEDFPSAPQPKSLYAMLASSTHTVAELVDFAGSLPAPWVRATVFNLLDSIREDGDLPSQCADVRRRKLVILGALIDRLIFEIERVPPYRQAAI